MQGREEAAFQLTLVATAGFSFFLLCPRLDICLEAKFVESFESPKFITSLVNDVFKYRRKMARD